MKPQDLKDKDLRHLIKLRLENERFMAKPTRIKLVTIFESGYRANVYTKEYAPHQQGFSFTKYFPNEFEYMKSKGVNDWN